MIYQSIVRSSNALAAVQQLESSKKMKCMTALEVMLLPELDKWDVLVYVFGSAL